MTDKGDSLGLGLPPSMRKAAGKRSYGYSQIFWVRSNSLCCESLPTETKTHERRSAYPVPSGGCARSNLAQPPNESDFHTGPGCLDVYGQRRDTRSYQATSRPSGRIDLNRSTSHSSGYSCCCTIPFEHRVRTRAISLLLSTTSTPATLTSASDLRTSKVRYRYA